jgi:hypothetical protein
MHPVIKPAEVQGLTADTGRTIPEWRRLQPVIVMLRLEVQILMVAQTVLLPDKTEIKI